MATSGSFTSSSIEGYSMRHDWELLSQDISTLKSVIKVTSYMIVASGYNFYDIGIRSSININGVVGQTYKQTSASNPPQTLTIGSVNLTVTHASDGSFSNKTFTASTPTNMSWASGTMSASGTITLPSIARASTFTIADSSINLGEALSVSISRASTSFTHTVKYIYGSQTVSHTGVATSDSYTTPLSWSSQVPNGTLLSGTIVVETYLSGSLIGSNSATFKAYVPSSVVPTISSLGLTGASLLDGAYVKGRSKVTATINGETGVYGSTISSRSIVGGGYSSTADSFQTGFLNMVGTNTFTAKVTDSRGRTATKTASIVVYDYALPVLTATAQRVNSAGSYDPNGTRIKVTASMAFSSVNSKNSKTLLRFRYKTSTGSWSSYTTITGTHYFTASVDYPYTVSIEYADEISGTLTKQIDVPSSISSIDVKAGGDGIAFGGSATKANTAEFFYDVEFNGEISGDVTFSGDVSGVPYSFSIHETFTTSTTNEYTGVSVTIPKYSTFIIIARVSAIEGYPSSVSINGSDTSSSNSFARTYYNATDGNAYYTSCTYAGRTTLSEQTFYVWSKHKSVLENSVTFSGWYLSEIL